MMRSNPQVGQRYWTELKAAIGTIRYHLIYKITYWQLDHVDVDVE